MKNYPECKEMFIYLQMDASMRTCTAYVGTVKNNIRPEFFNFSFYRPDRPEFSKIEKKIKVLFFNFIFRVRSDSPKKRAGKFRFLVRYINLPIPVSLRWFPS